MSAIAHGWKPKGSAKGIPVKVAKEFHHADAGKKYGQKHGIKHKDSEQHAMARVGTGETAHSGVNLRKPGRNVNHSMGESFMKRPHQIGMGPGAAEPMQSESYGHTALKGYYVGVGRGGGAWPSHEWPSGLPQSHTAGHANTAPNAHGYGHGEGQRKGALRLSGYKGAHQIGRGKRR
jgi:hypothetical protein